MLLPNSRRIRDAIASFHEDEDGIEALQVVMITAIAALVLIVLWIFGQAIIDWARGSLEGMSEEANTTKAKGVPRPKMGG